MQEKEVKSCIQKIILDNDMKAFALLVDAHKNLVYNLSLKMTRSRENAEEIAQDVFLKVFQGIRTFKGKSKFSTWLYQITYFTTLNYLRKHRMETREIHERDVIDHHEQPVSNLYAEDQKKYILEAFDHLNPEERALINFYYLADHSMEEIAVITKQSTGNVKVKIHRTRKKMHIFLQIKLQDETYSLIT